MFRGFVLLVALLPDVAAQDVAAPPTPAFDGNLSCIVQVRDLAAAIAWYRTHLGFDAEWRDDELGFAALRTPVSGVRLGLARHAEPQVGSGVVLTFGVHDLAAAERWFTAHDVATGPVETCPGLGKLLRFRDPDGNQLQLYQSLQAPPAEQAGLESVAFLAGSWVNARPGARDEEHWTAPVGGMMVGMNRTVRGGRAVFFEHLRIELRDGRVVYIASPRGALPVEFELDAAASTTTRAVFANPAHDFPKRIAYRLAPDGTLHARADDGTDSGEHQDFAWQRGGLR